jgi:uncharacterized protein YeaO (DUF488 family)
MDHFQRAPERDQMEVRGGQQTGKLSKAAPAEKIAMNQIKRAYDPAGNSDGTRLRVERLWPRGIAKTSLKIDSYDPAKWDEFCNRYGAELEANSQA